MKNLIFACSPRCGNTDALANAALKRLQDCALVQLRKCAVIPCNACDYCKTHGVCHIQDDAAALYQRLHAAEHVFFFAPVYFGGFDAHTKAFVDRAQSDWNRRKEPSLNRPPKQIYLISCGGQRTPTLFDGMIHELKSFCFAVGGVLRDALLFPSVDAAGALDATHFARLENFLNQITENQYE